MRRSILATIFIALMLTLVVGLHAYLAQRLVFGSGLTGMARTFSLLALAALAGSVVAHPAAERWLPRSVARSLAWPAALWMGFGFYLITLLAAGDLIAWLAGTAARAAPLGGAASAETSGAARALATVGLAGAIGCIALVSGLRLPRVRRVEIALRRWPSALDGFRIVQVSDLHIGPLLGRRFAQAVVERVNTLRPDLVAVTGDLVDGSVETLADEVAPLAGLRGCHGVYFVTGNHDYYSGEASWTAQARSLGMHVLRNEHVRIGFADACFDLAGVEDHHAHLVSDKMREDLSAALAERDPARPVLLLAHDPSTFKRASQMGVDLQLSGHTHGGQLWPFSLLVRMAVPFLAGLYERNGAKLYVSRGTGFWGPPMRFLAPAEITELVLRSE